VLQSKDFVPLGHSSYRCTLELEFPECVAGLVALLQGAVAFERSYTVNDLPFLTQLVHRENLEPFDISLLSADLLEDNRSQGDLSWVYADVAFAVDVL
jgi:hypothetical protein